MGGAPCCSEQEEYTIMGLVVSKIMTDYVLKYYYIYHQDVCFIGCFTLWVKGIVILRVVMVEFIGLLCEGKNTTPTIEGLVFGITVSYASSRFPMQ